MPTTPHIREVDRPAGSDHFSHVPDGTPICLNAIPNPNLEQAVFMCTRTHGHDGDHEAATFGRDGAFTVIAEWDQADTGLRTCRSCGLAIFRSGERWASFVGVQPCTAEHHDPVQS